MQVHVIGVQQAAPEQARQLQALRQEHSEKGVNGSGVAHCRCCAASAAVRLPFVVSRDLDCLDRILCVHMATTLHCSTTGQLSEKPPDLFFAG